MRRLLPLLLLPLFAACAAHRPAPPALEEATSPGLEQTPAPFEGEDLLAPCIAPGAAEHTLPAAAQAAFDRGDARCHAAVELALGRAVLARAGEDDEVRRVGRLHLRQAELRAERHGHDDLAAAARLARADGPLSQGDLEAALDELSRASAAADRHAAATGVADPRLDAIYLAHLTELLAEWERRGERTRADAALTAATRLKARESLRAFAARGVGPATLARAAGLPAAAEALEDLARQTEAVRGLTGESLRQAAAGRAAAAEALAQGGPIWTGAAPLLLDWLPGDLPDLAEAVRVVLGPGEVLLDYTVGEGHGALIALSGAGVEAWPLPGREALAAALAACEAGDCAALAEAVVAPAAGRLVGAAQVLVAAHDVLHEAPFEALLAGGKWEVVVPDTAGGDAGGKWEVVVPDTGAGAGGKWEVVVPDTAGGAGGGVPVFRTPSALALVGLRLRAWEQGPRAHPEAAALLPEDAVTPGEPPAVRAGPGPGAVAALRAALATGPAMVRWATGAEAPGRFFGAPLTVGVPDDGVD